MLKFLKMMLVPLALTIGLSSCDIIDGGSNGGGNSSPTEYTTDLSGYVRSANFDDNINDAVITIIVDGVETIYNLTDTNYYSISVYHSGSFTLQANIPSIPGFLTYSKTYTHTDETTNYSSYYDENILLQSNIYTRKYYVYRELKDAYSGSTISSSSVTSTAYKFSEESSYDVYWGGDLIEVTCSAPGYHTKTITHQFIDNNTDNYNYLSTIELFEDTLPLTVVTGKVTFYESTTPVVNARVSNTNGDSYDSVLTDENGDYSIDVYHRGTIELGFDKDEMQYSSGYINSIASSEVFDKSLSVQSDFWTVISGTITQQDTTPVENAFVSIGDFSATTDSTGYYGNLYLYKGTTETLTVIKEGFSDYTESISTYANSLTRDASMTVGTSSGGGNNGGSTGGTSNPAYQGNVTFSGSVTDKSTGLSISSGYITIGGMMSAFSGGSYSGSTDSSISEGNVIVQIIANGYLTYTTSVKCLTANETLNIELTPDPGMQLMTTFSGKIIDSETGTVPADLTGFTLQVVDQSQNIHSVNINTATGDYTASSVAHSGAVIFQGLDSNGNYHLLRRTVTTTDSQLNFDIEFDPK